jgi:hypothetical protein
VRTVGRRQQLKRETDEIAREQGKDEDQEEEEEEEDKQAHFSHQMQLTKQIVY